MKPIKNIGNYLECPYCGQLFGNGISIVYRNIVESCNCEGMTNAIKAKNIQNYNPTPISSISSKIYRNSYDNNSCDYSQMNCIIIIDNTIK